MACSFHIATHPANKNADFVKYTLQNLKKCIFFNKYLHISKKSYTFAP